MLQVTVTLTFDLLTQKSKGITYGSWLSMILRKLYLGEINLKVMSGQDFANAGQKVRPATCAITQYDRRSHHVLQILY